MKTSTGEQQDAAVEESPRFIGVSESAAGVNMMLPAVFVPQRSAKSALLLADFSAGRL